MVAGRTLQTHGLNSLVCYLVKIVQLVIHPSSQPASQSVSLLAQYSHVFVVLKPLAINL